MSSPAGTVRRILRQPIHVWQDLAYAQLMLVVAQLLVWSRPIGELVVPEAVGIDSPHHSKPATDPLAVRYAKAVRIAGLHGVFRPKCLVRAVALDRMVRGAGIPGSRIRIGVRVEDGKFAAHAWVELNGRVLGDRRDFTRQFAQIADVRVV